MHTSTSYSIIIVVQLDTIHNLATAKDAYTAATITKDLSYTCLVVLLYY